MRVLVIDDHALFRRCLTDYLSAQDDLTVAGETASPAAALQLANAEQPDLALVDIDLGDSDGFVVAQGIREVCPACMIVILTASESERQMMRAVAMGAKGYLLKDIEPDSLVTALRRVLDGETVFSRTFLFNQVRNSLENERRPRGGDTHSLLTPREVHILQLTTEGLIDKQVAAQLSVSQNTIKNHMKNIRRKLGASNRAHAISIGLRMGLIAVPRTGTNSARYAEREAY